MVGLTVDQPAKRCGAMPLATQKTQMEIGVIVQVVKAAAALQKISSSIFQKFC
jgi:hypothetical protein